jgi:hypothetical protein
MTSARTSPGDIRTQKGDPDAPLVRARRRGEPRWQQGVTSGCARVQEWSSRVDAGLFQADAIEPSVTSPLCAAKAARTSSFSRGGTPK